MNTQDDDDKGFIMLPFEVGPAHQRNKRTLYITEFTITRNLFISKIS